MTGVSGDDALEVVGLEYLSTPLRRAADTESPILLVGEAGSGRSTVARWLHERSPRAGGPLVEFNTHLVPPELFDSELFGHRRGAFTGAVADRDGRVAQAAGGTLVLDHVEDLPAAAQAKMLRLVGEGDYTPLGGEPQRADVRFVSIASPRLANLMDRGLFRADLLHRLEVLVFTLPPLAERSVPWRDLGQLLLEQAAERLGVQLPAVDPSSLDGLGQGRWRGHLTELRTHLERALLLAEPDAELRIVPPAAADGSTHRPRTLREVEEAAIREALAHTRGHQGEAAELLGISRKSLWERRRRYGIP